MFLLYVTVLLPVGVIKDDHDYNTVHLMTTKIISQYIHYRHQRNLTTRYIIRCPTLSSSKCGQCHVVSWRRKL